MTHPIDLERILELSAEIERLRADLVKTENALRAVVLAPSFAGRGEGSPSGSQTVSRQSRLRKGTQETEFLYTSNAYTSLASQLCLGVVDSPSLESPRGVVWLTENESTTVREENYARRLKRGAKTGVPRFRLAQGGE